MHGENNLVIGDLGHAKDLNVNSSSYLAPEANDPTKRSEKIDIWSFGCIVYELFYLEKLFNNRDPDKLRDSIRKFNIDELKLDTNKIKPNFIRILKK